MNDAPTTTPWTWADLVSSYQFWGIFFCFILLMLSHEINSVYLPLSLRETANFSYQEVGMFVSFKMLGIVIGFIPAWLASRTKNIYPLYFFIGLYLFSTVLLYYISHFTVTALLYSFLSSLSVGAILLLVPAIFANAAKNTEVFILSFGLIITLKFFFSAIFQSVIFSFFDYEGSSTLFSVLFLHITLIVLAIIILLPVKRCLFNEVPKIRSVTAATPVQRDPVAVFFLSFIPFYLIYWLVKTHREIRTFSQSPSLLTPKAAGWISFFAPLVFPVILSTLNDNIRGVLQNKGKNVGYKTWLIILLGIFIPPLSTAMVQGQINRLTSDQTQ